MELIDIVMLIIKIVASILFAIAIICFLDLNPRTISEDIVKLATKNATLKNQADQANSKKKKKETFGQKIIYIHDALKSTGKETSFSVLCVLTLLFFALGTILAIIINNPFLIPGFGLFFGMLPYLSIKRNLDNYNRRIKDELETTLSIITTSYVRTGDLLFAVQENLPFIKPPLKEHFTSFIGDATYVTDIKSAIYNLKSKVNDAVYEEWCDALIQCQDDRTLTETLQPIVQRLTDIRIVNNDITVYVAEAKTQYFTMVGLLVGIVPLLYMLNKDWYNQLMFSVPGRVALGIDMLIIVLTYLKLLKYTRPIDSK